MSFIHTQTFEFKSEGERERQFIHDVLWLMAEKRYTEAHEMLIKRHDELTADPKLKIYDQREERRL